MTHKHSGFTLLEMLVAMAILAMSLGMLYRASGGAAHSVGDLESYQRATVLAESLLSMRDAVSDAGWNESGSSGKYGWQVSSAPYATQFNGPNIPLLHQIHIVISWSDGIRPRELVLDTLLPQRKPPQPAGSA